MDGSRRYAKGRKLRLVNRMRNATDPLEAARLAITVYNSCYKNTVHQDAEEPAAWMTTENGHHVPLDKNGIALAGGGGTLKGMDFSDAETSPTDSASKSEPKPAPAAPKMKDLTQPHKPDKDELANLEVGSHITLIDPEDGSETDWATVTINDMGQKSIIWDGSPDNSSTCNLEDSFDRGEFIRQIQGQEITVTPPNISSTGERMSGQPFADYSRRFRDAFSTSEPWEYDNKYREQTGSVWKSLSDEERNALYWYTEENYERINNITRGKDNSMSYNEEIDSITKAIDQSTMKEDTILFRGTSTSALEKLLNIPEDSLEPESVRELIGRIGTDDGFMSTGSSEGKGFPKKKVQFEIMAPAGTKALYAEPFSYHGEGRGFSWDGEEEQSRFSKEQETILQRGTTLAIVDAAYRDGKYRIKAAVVAQDYSKSEYSKKRANSEN